MGARVPKTKAHSSISAVYFLPFIGAVGARVPDPKRIRAFEQFIVLAFIEAMERWVCAHELHESKRPHTHGRCFGSCVTAVCVLHI